MHCMAARFRRRAVYHIAAAVQGGQCDDLAILGYCVGLHVLGGASDGHH